MRMPAMKSPTAASEQQSFGIHDRVEWTVAMLKTRVGLPLESLRYAGLVFFLLLFRKFLNLRSPGSSRRKPFVIVEVFLSSLGLSCGSRSCPHFLSFGRFQYRLLRCRRNNRLTHRFQYLLLLCRRRNNRPIHCLLRNRCSKSNWCYFFWSRASSNFDLNYD